ncbi:hypothetical protein [Paenibacillus sinopodophylli]|uniref:hypothetical protein n=1 Tax=Paenibacillus sinopodophylli TaxID=1837342 RepID=UPI001BB289EA|nr:hypothetical protein [Paenibacillus sinopodophylli]
MMEAGVDYIVSNVGGCGALLVEYDHFLHEDFEYDALAKWFVSKVIDVIKAEEGLVTVQVDIAGVKSLYIQGDVKGDTAVFVPLTTSYYK